MDGWITRHTQCHAQRLYASQKLIPLRLLTLQWRVCSHIVILSWTTFTPQYTFSSDTSFRHKAYSPLSIYYHYASAILAAMTWINSIVNCLIYLMSPTALLSILTRTLLYTSDWFIRKPSLSGFVLRSHYSRNALFTCGNPDRNANFCSHMIDPGIYG